MDIPVIEADITRIRVETGWEPRIPLAEALRETLEYWRTRTGNTLTQSRSK
jgi:GDP-4-dehydro-6-deoxy-D-mannose reductase